MTTSTRKTKTRAPKTTTKTPAATTSAANAKKTTDVVAISREARDHIGKALLELVDLEADLEVLEGNRTVGAHMALAAARMHITVARHRVRQLFAGWAEVQP